MLTVLFQFIMVCELLKSYHGILTRLRSGLELDHGNTSVHFFFSSSLVDLLPSVGTYFLLLGLVSFNRASHLTQEYFGKQRSSWSFQWPRCSGPVSAKRAQIITPPPPCLAGGMRCLWWYAVFGFHQMRCCALWSDIFTCVFPVHKTLFQKSCSLFRCNFMNLCCARRVFLLQLFQTSHTCSVFF